MPVEKKLPRPRSLSLIRALVLVAALPAAAPADDAGASPAAAKEPPLSWIDPDTGHRVLRLTREPGSVSFYFNDNAYTPDGKEMVYTSPAGICVLDLATLASRAVVPGPARAIVVGRKTPTIFYTKRTQDPQVSTLWSTNVDTGETRKLADLPPRGSVSTINADETLACGTFLDAGAVVPGANGGNAPAASQTASQNRVQPANKTQMMERRLAARLPINMYTIDLGTGKVTVLIHSTDWLNHMQFSPTDPALLLYAHEGLWWLVDRIWTIRTDGTQNQLVHKRTMENEIAGHEWWGLDGKTVWYQLHYPNGMESSFIAGYRPDSGERVWYHYTPDQSSIHDNSSGDDSLFCGDGDKHSPWIFLLRPVRIADKGTLGTNLVKGGYLESEKLVNMSKHDYALEPNPSFTPDKRLVIFASNMFGPSYVFGVEVAKAAP
jgi:oligogalacturonide lyase